jgi:hypothetical protein
MPFIFGILEVFLGIRRIPFPCIGSFIEASDQTSVFRRVNTFFSLLSLASG